MPNTYFDDDDCGAVSTAPAQEKPVTETQIDRFFQGIRPEDSEKLKRCIHQQVARMGFLPASVREDGRIWEKARLAVAENLIRGGMTIADVEFAEEDGSSKKASRVKADCH